MDYHRLTLDNGLRLLYTPMPAMQSVTVAMFVGLGSRYEPSRDAGVAHLIEHMLFKGTEKRPRATDISDSIESVGGLLNASTDKELTVYWCKVALPDMRLAIDLLSDMLLHSRLVTVDVARERGVVMEEISMIFDDSQEWVHVLADEMLWPYQPVGREIAGTRDSVSHLRRRDLLSYMGQYYGPNNAVLSVAGGIDVNSVRSLAEEHFGDWAPVSPSLPPPAQPSRFGARSRVEHRNTEQVNLCLAYPGISRFHPDRHALDLLCSILGGGGSSRLFVQLRERHGLVYEVHSYADHLSDTGSTIIYAGVDAQRSRLATDAILHEVERLHKRRVTDRELQRAKQSFRGRLFLGLEDTQAVANWFGAQEILHHGVMLPHEVANLIDEVSADDLLRVARAYLRPDEAQLAVVGPAAGLSLESRPAVSG